MAGTRSFLSAGFGNASVAAKEKRETLDQVDEHSKKQQSRFVIGCCGRDLVRACGE
jgi:hypothetical protein